MILAYVLGYLNAIRGSGVWNRDWWIMLMSINIAAAINGAASISIPHTMMLVPFIFLILLVGFVPGWGKYFNMSYTNMAYINEVEFKPIDWICNKLLGKPTTMLAFKRWCFLAMSIRGMLFYPLFIFLSFINPLALVYGFGVLSMGLIYWLRKFTPESHSIRIAEFAYLCVYGALIHTSLTVY